MKNRVSNLIILVFSVILVMSGCSKVETKAPQSIEEQGLEGIFEESGENTVSYGQFGFGINTNATEMQLYEFNGTEVRIPYYVEGMDTEVNSTFGVLLFVDGVAQPYQIGTANGEISNIEYMHKFSLGYGERYEFDLIFMPISGKVGEKVGFITATILNPDYLPASTQNAKFGLHHSLSSIVPQEIQINSNIVNDLHPFSDIRIEDISQDILDMMQETYSNDVYDILDATVILELVDTENEEQNIIYSKDSKAKIKMRLYGGLEVTDRITVFVNNEPIKIKESDYIEVGTQKNMMCTAEFEIDMAGYEELNSIYAIVMTTRSDYFIQDIYKSNTMLLVKK